MTEQAAVYEYRAAKARKHGGLVDAFIDTLNMVQNAATAAGIDVSMVSILPPYKHRVSVHSMADLECIPGEATYLPYPENANTFAGFVGEWRKTYRGVEFVCCVQG